MVRHIVMWKFLPGTEKEREAFLTALQGLYGVIPQMKTCEIQRNVGPGDYDAAIIADFESVEDVQTYLDDPRHLAVAGMCKPIRESRAGFDYTI